MDGKLISLFTILFGCLFLLQQIQAFRQPTCRGKEAKLTPEEMKMMGDCLKEFSSGGSTSLADVPKDSMGCVGKCILQRQGLVDEKGMPSKDRIYKMVNETLEAEVAQLADEKLGKCIDQNSASLDPKAESCKTYWPLVQCVAAAFIEICAEPKSTTES